MTHLAAVCLAGVFTASITFSPVVTAVPRAFADASAQDAAQTCRDWKACRQLALDAAGRKDYDAFHDLAWRTMQAGPKNDPELMLLVARAQSLSGRPHDALVMLQRIAALGFATDAATSDDFDRVRALPGWADLEAKITGAKPVPTRDTPAPPPTSEPAAKPPAPPAKPDPPAASKPSPATPPKPASEKPAPEKPAAEKPATEKPVAEKPAPEKPAPVEKPAPTPPAAPTAAAAGSAATTRASKGGAPAPLVLPATGLNVVGLGYDAVSERFLVGDRQERKLLVLGERSGRLASLAGADAGFSEITAFEIDTREGDLWVVSGAGPSQRSTLHKLQLISGRVLASIPMPEELGSGRFADVAVTPQSILVLDSEGRRVLRAAKKGKVLEVAARLAVPGAVSLAPSSDVTAFAAYDQGLLRVDLTTRSMSVVEPPAKTTLDGLVWIRWHRGSLVGLQKQGGGLRLVRIRMDDTGRSARAVDVLDPAVPVSAPTSATIAGNTVYYLGSSADTAQLEVKRLVLK